MREKSYIERRKRGKNREREKTRESRKVESRETDPIRRKGKRILRNGGERAAAPCHTTLPTQERQGMGRV